MPELQRTTDGGAHKQTIRNFHDSYESKVVKRDRSVASTNETLHGIGANQTSDQHLQKPASPSDTESSGDTKINQDFKRQDNPLRATGCITKDNNWHPTESATYDRTIRHHGTSHGRQGSREDDCVGQSDQQSLRNNVHENPMGGVHNAKNGLSWHTGILQHKKVQSSTSTMLQVPEVSAHFQNLSEQPRCLRSLWRETPHQSLCRKEEQKGGHHAEMQQLSRGSQYSKQQVSRSEGVNKEDPTSDKTGRCPSFKRQTGIATSIRPNNGRFSHSNIKKTIFDTKASRTRNTKLPSSGNSTDKKRHVPTPVTPQKKRLASGDGKTDIIRKTVVADKPPLAPPRSSVQQVTKNPQKPTALKTSFPQDLPPSNMFPSREGKMSIQDIVKTSQLIMEMQQQLLQQMCTIAPNRYIHSIMNVISQNMNEISAKYASCIGTHKV